MHTGHGMSLNRLETSALTREEQIRRDSFRFLVSVVVFAWINIIFWFYIMGFPMVNSVWENESPQELPVSYRGGILWYIIFFIIINGLLPLSLLFLVTQPNSLIRADLHLIIAWLCIVFSAIAFIGITLVYLFWCNTSISAAAVACNSGDWCCVFNTSPGNENQCPSTTPCNPPKTREDLGGSNGEWSQYFWLSLALIAVSLFHWLINRVIHATGLASAYTAREAKIFAAVFLLASAGFFFWFIGILVVNLNFLCGYPLLEGGAGVGTYTCTLYSWDYWFIWLLFLNALPLVAFGAALVVNDTSITPTAHQICAVAAALVTLASFIYFIGILVFKTNNYLLASPLSISNNERYCCEYFGSNPDICPNTTPCIAGTSVRMVANPSDAFLKVFIASVGFLVNVTFHLVLNNRMKKYKVFYSPIDL